MIRTMTRAVEQARCEPHHVSTTRVHHAQFRFKRAAFFHAPTLALVSAFGFALALPAAPAFAADAPTLKIGTATSPQIEALKVAVREAKEQGLDVKVIEFTDWNTPNAALANRDIDVNYFQHIPFLENAKKQGGYNFVAIALARS